MIFFPGTESLHSRKYREDMEKLRKQKKLTVNVIAMLVGRYKATSKGVHFVSYYLLI